VAARSVHEQRQRVGRAGDLARDLQRGRLVLALLDLDVVRFEVRAQLADLVGVQIVLEREGLELLLGDYAALLDLVEEGADGCFDVRRVQLPSLLLPVGWMRLRGTGNRHGVRIRTDLNEWCVPGIPGRPNVDSCETLPGSSKNSLISYDS
jgi:hypothetical protein